MSRTIKEIYDQIVAERNKRLELQEFNNDSKLSIMNGIVWIIAAAIHSFEAILDVFMIDISTTIDSRINGTPTYYINALKKYQKGDELMVRDDGLAFGYAETDTTKQIITQASYTESGNDDTLDNKLILKVATGDTGDLHAIDQEELVLIQSYINKIKFAGTRIEVISLTGDVLIPRLEVYYDGGLTTDDMYTAIEDGLNTYMQNIGFDSAVYTSDIVRALLEVDHVTDVYIDSDATPEQGIFIAKYDADNNIKALTNIGRMTYTASGYLKESTGEEKEKELPKFRESIILKVSKGNEV